MSDPVLDDAVQSLVDPCVGEQGDWRAVLERAGTARPRRRRRKRLGALVVAFAVAAVLALFATPALGLREAVLRLVGRTDVDFERGTPAPSVIRREFGDLGIGAPPGMDPRAVAGKTRKVGTLPVSGRQRALWVAPTADGGFCYRVDGVGGGCQGRQAATPLSIGAAMRLKTTGGPPEVTRIEGTVRDRRIVRLSVEFRDGHAVDVPFVFVSAPIDAGFLAYDVPAGRRTTTRGPVSVTGWDAHGKRIARDARGISYRIPRALLDPVVAPPQLLPGEPPVAPSNPVQHGSANGVAVAAGRNGAVRFDLAGIDAERDRALDGRAAVGCFRLRGSTGPASLLTSGRYTGTSIAVRIRGIETPFDGCEIQGVYGHRWPDRFGSHTAIEIPFNAAARRHFADRAAARDLALLVRARRVQEIRRLDSDKAVAALRALYGNRLAYPDDATARPPAGTIGVRADGARLVFTRDSEAGRSFEVVVANGRIAGENLSPLALVF